MRQHENSRAFLLVKAQFPEAYASVMSQLPALLSDTSLIPVFYQDFSESNQDGIDPEDRNELFNQRILFISSILNIYCPVALFNDLRVTGNVCSILTRVLGYNNRQSISELVSQCRAYIKGERFQKRVEELSDQFLERAESLRGNMAEAEAEKQYILEL